MVNSKSPPQGWPSWLDTTDHIGSHYPYYTLPRPDSVSLQIGEIIKDIPKSDRKLDLTAVVEMVFGRRILGDRTLIQGVRRVPWMAECFHDGFKYHDIPNHGTHSPHIGQVVGKFQRELRKEVRGYVQEGDNVGILLSGGLDSRILAGLLREVELDGIIDSITAFTWGIRGSRDVAYARQVTEQYDWQFKHIQLNSDLLWNNIIRTGKIGAEFAPYHLHALPIIREADNIDVMLAGSYGNSVGRGEYAGDHVTELKPVVPQRLNKFGVLPNEIVSNHQNTIYGDAYGYRGRISRDHIYQYREIEQQLHYMRRGLQSCMTHVAEEIPLYQIFTAPSVVNVMWELNPQIRGIDHYKELLSRLPGELKKIPDAKLGNLDGPSGVNEDLAIRAHNYGKWLRDDLREDVIGCILDGPLVGQLFNERTINGLLDIWPRASTTTMNRIDDIISWLASLSVFVEEYDVSVPRKDTGVADVLNTIIGLSHAESYRAARDRLRV